MKFKEVTMKFKGLDVILAALAMLSIAALIYIIFAIGERVFYSPPYSISDSVSPKELEGSILKEYDYKTNKIKLKLASGELKEYTVTKAPLKVLNPEVVDDKIVSDLYVYMWEHIEYRNSNIRIVDWNPETKVLVVEGYRNRISKLIHGIDGFYKD